MQIQIRGRIDLSVTSPALAVPDHPPSGGGVAILDPWLPISSPPMDLVPMNGSARVDLYLCVGTSKRLLESYQVQGTQTKSLQVDKSWTTSEEGEVSVVAECWALLHGSEQRAMVDLYDFSLSGVKRHEDFDLVKISHGGMVHLYGIDRYIYISKNDPNVMTIGGNTLQRGNHRLEGNLEVTGTITMSGSLARGEVSKMGITVWCNGCKAIPAGRSNGFSELLSDKSYKVYHNVGHTRYAVSITPTEDTAPICACVIERRANYFRVMLRKGSDWNMATNKISSSFTYAIEGNLTAQ